MDDMEQFKCIRKRCQNALKFFGLEKYSNYTPDKQKYFKTEYEALQVQLKEVFEKVRYKTLEFQEPFTEDEVFGNIEPLWEPERAEIYKKSKKLVIYLKAHDAVMIAEEMEE